MDRTSRNHRGSTCTSDTSRLNRRRIKDEGYENIGALTQTRALATSIIRLVDCPGQNSENVDPSLID